jgi:hypothetical protein
MLLKPDADVKYGYTPLRPGLTTSTGRFISNDFEAERLDSSHAENDGCAVVVFHFCQCSIPSL